MKLSLALNIGLRYTRASKKSGMLSFLSSVSMAGLVLGISLLIVVLSVMNGFERELRERILGLLPHAALYQAGGIENWSALADTILEKEGVSGAAPFIQVESLLSYRRSTVPALIYGIDVEAERKISLIERYTSADELKALMGSSNSVLLGIDLAKKLQVQRGTEIMVISPGKNSRRSARMTYLKVAGFINSGSELDQSLVLAPMQGLDALRDENLKGRVDGLRLKFTDLDDAPYRAMQLASELGPTFYQNNWQRTHGNLYHAIQMSKTLVGLLMSLIVALAAFNVVSTLILVVVEKQASIAILRTLGASSKTILMIFITQGLVIGTGGVALGLAIGCGLVAVIEPLVQALQSVLGVHFLHSDVYPLTEIPAEIRMHDLVTVVTVSLVLVFLATLYPAWKASRLQPAAVLRYE